jgi:histidinol-phosphate aminotransferase
MAKAAGKTLFEGLLARKILVRNYSQHPLLPGALRISTGSLEENARIIEAVKEILEG